LSNAEIARLDVVTWVRTQDLTVVCEFNFSGLPLHIRTKKKKVLDFVDFPADFHADITPQEYMRILLLR